MARGSKVWLNGEIRPAESTRMSLFTHALHYGTGAFEGIRAYKQAGGGGGIFRLKEHIDRLFDSMKILTFDIGFKREQLIKACVDLCKENGFEECYLRPIAFVGDTSLGVDPGPDAPVDMAIISWEWGSYLGDKGVAEGARLKTSSFIRPHPNSVMTKGKISGQYVTGVIAKREAKKSGYDEALLLDPTGYLSEGTGENIFMVSLDGVIKTTPLTSILPGITRRTVIQHLREKGFKVEEQAFTRDELWSAREVFLTGTAAEVTPVQSIDDRPIGDGKPGPISTKLRQEYLAIVRGDVPPYGKDWVTPIQ